MKKLFSLVLVICLLMSVVAFAQPSPVLQDQQPPKLVTYVNANGDSVFARICDKDGNVLAEITEEGELVMTDVHDRKNAANGVIVSRLTEAYESVMEFVHHSDVDCKLHDHSVKVDVDTILASLDQEMDSHDLVMFEMFDVMIPDEAAALLTDGAYIELVFELIEDHQHLPVITMFTGDGVEWMVIPTTHLSEKQFSVQLPTRGTIVLLNDGRVSMGIGQDVERVVTVVPGEDGSETEGGQGNFTPSVSGKPAPQIVTFTGEDGKTYVGYIRSNDGSVEIKVPDKNYIVITSVAEREYVPDIQTYEHLEWGFNSILEAENVGKLFTEHDMSQTLADEEHQTLAGALDETLAQLGLDLTHDQLVVKDLFEVTAYGDYLHDLYDENNYLEVTFKTSIDSDKPMVVIHSADSVHWHVHPIDEYAVHEDGIVNLRMYELGAVAFLVEAEVEINEDTAVQSPV